MKNKRHINHWFQSAIPFFLVFTFATAMVTAQRVTSDKSLIMFDLIPSTETNLEIVTTEFSVNENTHVGEIVDTVKTDTQDTVLFEILDPVGYFDIRDTSGIITITRSPDHEEVESIDFRLRAVLKDSMHVADTKNVNIQINDINEPPVVEPATFDIAEKSPPLSVVGEVQATDPDSGDVLQFSLLENPNDIFSIDPATGDILVNDSSYLDQELNPTLFVTVMAADDNIPSLTDTAQVRIDIITLVSSENLSHRDEKPVLYPNPADDRIWLLLPGINKDIPIRMELFDTAGKRLRTFKIKIQTKRKYRLDVSNLKTGIYILKLNQDGHEHSFRFFKD